MTASLAVYTRSTLPDPRGMQDVQIILIETTGERGLWYSDGTAWNPMRVGFTDSSATPGAASHVTGRGRMAIAAGVASVVLTNPLIKTTSSVEAWLSGAGADATLTQILRSSSAAGAATFTGNANATAATQLDYVIFN